MTHFPENSEADARFGILTPAVADPSPPLSAACMAPRFFHAFSRKRSWKLAVAGASDEEAEEAEEGNAGRAAAGVDPTEADPGADADPVTDPDPDAGEDEAEAEAEGGRAWPVDCWEADGIGASS